MTCIVAHKKDGVIYMGGDSFAGYEHRYRLMKESKVFIKDNIIFGCCGSFRMMDLLRYKLNIPPFLLPKERPDLFIDSYVHTAFMDSVIECFEKNGFSRIDNNEKEGGTFMVGIGGKIFSIYDDFQAMEYSGNTTTMGSGEMVALGAMNAIEMINSDMHPAEKIEIALRSTAECVPNVRKPFSIISLVGRG